MACSLSIHFSCGIVFALLLAAAIPAFGSNGSDTQFIGRTDGAWQLVQFFVRAKWFLRTSDEAVFVVSGPTLLVVILVKRSIESQIFAILKED